MSRVGRRATDRIATDAMDTLSKIERDIATLRKGWADCFPPAVATRNGAHVGNFYEASIRETMKGKRHGV